MQSKYLAVALMRNVQLYYGPNMSGYEYLEALLCLDLLRLDQLQ